MKTKNYTIKTITGVLLSAAMIFTFSSCHKDASTTTSGTITESQAAQVATDAVTPSTGGMVSQVAASAAFFSSSSVSGGTVSSVNGGHLALNSTLVCGVAKDSSVSYASTGTSIPSYTYSLSWVNTLACAIPSTFTCNFVGKGSYDGLVFSSSFNSTGGFVVSNLSSSAPTYTFTSNFSRQGTTTSKVGAMNTFTHSLTITSSNIIYNKSAAEIASGTATVSITVTSTSGKSWNYAGTLTFLGNKTATLVLNSGVVYNMSWT